MRLFVSEYVCSGAWPDAVLPESLAREGRAMLLAFLEDAARVPDCEVWTTWDERRCGRFPLPQVTCQTPCSPEAEWNLFQSLARQSDATYIIAPEIGNELTRRCRMVVERGRRSLNTAPDAIELCSDKLRLAERLIEAGIPTIDTALHDPQAASPYQFPVVLKPRFGAGSESVCLCEDDETLRRSAERLESSGLGDAVIQLFVDGDACSVAALFDEDGGCRSIFPVARQRLSADGRFLYLGGEIDARREVPRGVERMIFRIGKLIPGFRGYIGFDFVRPQCHSQDAILVEINPRLTTSYLGYRSLARSNLAESILRRKDGGNPIRWKPEAIEFSPDGLLTGLGSTAEIGSARVAVPIRHDNH